MSIYRKGEGSLAGWKARQDRCNVTRLSQPMEHIITGLPASATAPRMMLMFSALWRLRQGEGAAETLAGAVGMRCSDEPHGRMTASRLFGGRSPVCR